MVKRSEIRETALCDLRLSSTSNEWVKRSELKEIIFRDLRESSPSNEWVKRSERKEISCFLKSEDSYKISVKRSIENIFFFSIPNILSFCKVS